MLNADIFNDNYNVNERDDDSDFDDLGKFYFYIFLAPIHGAKKIA